MKEECARDDAQSSYQSQSELTKLPKAFYKSKKIYLSSPS